MEVQTHIEYVNMEGLNISYRLQHFFKMKYASEPATYNTFMVCLVQTYTITLLVSANTLNALKTTDVM